MLVHFDVLSVFILQWPYHKVIQVSFGVYNMPVKLFVYALLKNYYHEGHNMWMFILALLMSNYYFLRLMRLMTKIHF